LGKKEEATLIVKVKDSGTKAMKGINKVFSKFVFTAGDVVAGMKAIGAAAINFVKLGSEIKAVRTAFNNLAASQGQDAQEMLRNMRELSLGTITDLELMKQANNALLLGLPVDRFGDMLTIARSSAQATGESMEFMLKSIVTGLGRGSKLMLDNLGILVSADKANVNYAASLGRTAASLTEAERKQAFINEALRIGKDNAEAAGGAQITLAEKMQQSLVVFENMKTVLAENLGPALNVFFNTANRAFTGLSNLLSGGDFAGVIGRIALEVDTAALAFEALGATIGTALAGAFTAMKAALTGNFEESKELALLAIEDIKEIQATAEEERLATLAEFNQRQSNLEKNKNTVDAKARKAFLKKQVAEEKAAAAAKLKIETEKNKAHIAGLQSAFSQISTLQGSHNKGLVAIGKSAALANIIINTQAGASKAWALGPIIGPPLAAAVILAGAAQAARVSGVQLAEGGIVQATQGGVQATIGEGGRDEAVVPLPDDFDPDSGGGLGGGSTFIFNGPVLGDEGQAREFAVAIDGELLKLRQRNESLSFDSGVI
jgi:hypothetical protein